MNPETRLDELINEFPFLLHTAQKLNEHRLDWMIAGSTCLYVYGNARQPKDVDFYLRSAEHDTADIVFGIKSFSYTSSKERVRNSNPGGDHAMQLTSDLYINRDGNEYFMEPTALVFDHRTVITCRSERFYFAPVEEVLLIKALLGRGLDAGKNDIEDIKSFLYIHPDVDGGYLRERQVELGIKPSFFSDVTASPK